MASNVTLELEIIDERYCRKCDEDVQVILDRDLYDDVPAAICIECGHEFEMDLSDYEVDEAAERFDIERKEQ